MMQKIYNFVRNWICMKKNRYFSYDRLGIIASVACAIHCTVLPLFISSLPFLGIDVLESAWVEWALLLAALLFGVLSFYHGYKRHHRKTLPIFLFIVGFSCLLLNQATDERFLYLLIPVSATCIITAHCLNIYYCRRSGKCYLTSSVLRKM